MVGAGDMGRSCLEGFSWWGYKSRIVGHGGRWQRRKTPACSPSEWACLPGTASDFTQHIQGSSYTSTRNWAAYCIRLAVFIRPRNPGNTTIEGPRPPQLALCVQSKVLHRNRFRDLPTSAYTSMPSRFVPFVLVIVIDHATGVVHLPALEAASRHQYLWRISASRGTTP